MWELPACWERCITSLSLDFSADHTMLVVGVKESEVSSSCLLWCVVINFAPSLAALSSFSPHPHDSIPPLLCCPHAFNSFSATLSAPGRLPEVLSLHTGG